MAKKLKSISYNKSLFRENYRFKNGVIEEKNANRSMSSQCASRFEFGTS